MEYYTNNIDQYGLLEELLGLREMDHHFNNADSLGNFTSTNANANAFYAPFGEILSPPDFTNPYPYYYSTSSFLDDAFANGSGLGAPCKPEPASESQIKKKKLNGQPSKNLMAERRRRKRLNDRLSMLRSVVPKISKMDRTSILGDTIDYMKELLDRINSLQEETHFGGNQFTIFKDVKPNENLLRNSPKFEVERRNPDTRIEICCGAKPGLLVSTLTTLEALGLEIQQCVISCFNDFALQASCSEDLKNIAILDPEDIKQALLRNAGYGGNCL